MSPAPSPEGERPYRPISDYALIGNGHGSALVATDGSIDWCCLERFDHPPVFSRILDRARGGHFRIAAAGPAESRRAYLPRTNLLETTFSTPDGVARVLDLMVAREDTGVSQPNLLRIVTGVSGRVAMRLEFRPLPGFAEAFPPVRVDGARAEAEGCPTLLSDVPLRLAPGDGGAMAEFEVGPGEVRAFRLFAPGAEAHDRVPAMEVMERARASWAEWADGNAYRGPLEEEMVRSALVLKALIYAPTGALVAAPTTSLPEEIGGVRNYDYRYCWLRDSCLGFYALKKFGHVAEAQRFFEFVRDVPRRADGGLKPLYRVDGEDDLGEQEVSHFEGWRGSAPVRHGNEAGEQHQLDVYGQMLDLLFMQVRLGGEITAEAREGGPRIADLVAAGWREPDNGLWEPRLEPKRYLHAAIMNWVALDRAVRLFGERPAWCEARDAIVADVHARGVHPERGVLTQYFGSDDVDASVLLAPLVGFPVDEALFARTVDAVIERLGRGPLLYRYLSEDGLPGHEGTFVLCAFWLVDALCWLGRGDEARERFDALRAMANDVGLFPEELDEDGTFLGNFPQAFSHLGFLHSALVLDLFEHGGRDAVRGTYADRALRETSHRHAARTD